MVATFVDQCLDDDELVLQSLGMLLSREGFAVTPAANGAEALDLAAEQTFDLVICDIRMPDLDGLEVVRRLREELVGAHFVMITGFASEDAPVEALRLGVEDYIRKPFDLPTFLKRIRSICRQRRQKSGSSSELVLWRFSERLRRLDTERARRVEEADTLCLRAGKALGLTADQLQAVRLAAHFYDVCRSEGRAREEDLEASDLLGRVAHLVFSRPSPAVDEPASQLLAAAVAVVEGRQVPAGLDSRVTDEVARLCGTRPEQVETPEAPRARLQVFTLGYTRVLVDGQEVDRKAWESSRARWLFFYLLSQRGRRVPQERLQELFWPESDPDKSRRALVSTVHRARKALGSNDVIARGERSYGLSRDQSSWWDVDELERRSRLARSHDAEERTREAICEYEAAVSLYRGEFAVECAEEWAEEIRRRVHLVALECLERLAALLLPSDAPAAERQARKAIEFEATSEPAYATLIRALADQGKRDEAVRAYHQCCKRLEEELDLSAGPEVTRAYLEVSA